MRNASLTISASLAGRAYLLLCNLIASFGAVYWFVKVHLAKHKEQAGGPDTRAPQALVLTLVSIGPWPAMVQSPDVPKQYRTMAAVVCIRKPPPRVGRRYVICSFVLCIRLLFLRLLCLVFQICLGMYGSLSSSVSMEFLVVFFLVGI